MTATHALNTVMIVDDDSVFCHSLARAFSRAGINTLTAHDGESALTHIANTSLIDAVVLDLRLGQENGLLLLNQVRQQLPQARIVMLTGFASIATAVEAMKRGANDYLIKPATLDDILEALADDEITDSVDASDNEPLNLRQMAWEHIQRVLTEHEGNVSAAARTLGVHRRTLQRKLAKAPRPQ